MKMTKKQLNNLIESVIQEEHSSLGDQERKHLDP